MTRRRYGTLAWVDHETLGPHWGMQVEPHVAIKIKRWFPKVRQSRQNMLSFADTPSSAADIEWFLLRYPLDMADDVAERLETRAAAHREAEERTVSILEGKQFLDEFPPPARAPRDYQTVAAELAYHTGGTLIGDDLGLGKTQTALMVLRDPSTLPALIVVPTHLQTQWERETAAVMPHLRQHTISSTKTYDVDADLLICTYGKLHGWREALSGQIKTVMFDEAHELRNGPGTKKYDASEAIAYASDRRVGLTGTPVFNYGSDAWNVWNVLMPGALGGRDEFVREWGGATYNGHVEVNDPLGLGAYLRELGLLINRNRADVGRELPPVVEEVIEVQGDESVVDGEMDRLIAMAEKVLYGTRQERFVASGDLDLKMRQVTGIAKAPEIADFARLVLGEETKIVMYAYHRGVYDIWNKALADFNPVMYTGSETPAAKDRSVRQFLEDDTCRIFMCSLRSGSGLDALQQVASVLIFGELDWSPATHHQAIGRLNRDGQIEGKSVLAYYMLSRVGSDPIMGGILERKRQQAEGIMRKGDAPIFAEVSQGDEQERSRRMAISILQKAGRVV